MVIIFWRIVMEENESENEFCRNSRRIRANFCEDFDWKDYYNFG